MLFYLMAVTATAAFGENADLPTTPFVNPTLPDITVPRTGGYKVDIPQVRNSNENVAATVLLTEIQLDFVNNQADFFLLDSALTITAALTIQTTEALNNGDDVSIYKDGTDVWRCRVTFEYTN